MSVEMRSALAPYEGQRVSVVGYYSASGVAHPAHIKTACVEDCEVTTADGKTHRIGHTWVQHANVIVNCRPLKGAKLTFTAVVGSYSHRLGVPNADGLLRETAWGLTRPEGVEIVRTDELDFAEPPLPKALFRERPAPAPAPAGPPKSPVEIVLAVKELIAKVDPEALRKSVPHLTAIVTAVSLSGGEGDFLSLLNAIGG